MNCGVDTIPLSVLWSDWLAIDKSSDELRAKPCEKQRPSLHNTNLMPFVLTDLKLPCLCEPNRKHLDLVDDQYAVHPDFQSAPELIKGEIDAVSLLGTDFEGELHAHRLAVTRNL